MTMRDTVIVRDNLYRIVVKGDENEVRDACAKRSIAVQTAQRGVCGVVAVVRTSHLTLYRWFVEVKSRHAPYPSGTLLHYTLEAEAKRATR